MSPRRGIWQVNLAILLAASITGIGATSLAGQEQCVEDRLPSSSPTAPLTKPNLRALEERVQLASERIITAVVAVEEAEAPTAPSGTQKSLTFLHYASGVIISADGLILSQFHVSHRLAHEPLKSRRPGEHTSVILSDGRRLKAELLGADPASDLSLLQLVDSGPYPHVQLDPSTNVRLGDWALKVGHPLGYRPGRPPVVRLGRVLFANEHIFVTDCLITGGDSGGPFFDLDGRLLGLIMSSTVPAKLQGSLNIDTPLACRTGPSSATTNRFIRQRMDGMIRRQMMPIDDSAFRKSLAGFRRADAGILPRQQWTRGKETIDAFQDFIRPSRAAVTSVLDEAGHHAAYGTIVGADGWVVTMATTLPAEPRCRISEQRTVTAQVVGVAPAFDLALLKLPVNDVSAIRWAENTSPAVGTILAAMGTSDSPLAIGVVSVSRRDLSGPFPARASHYTIRAARPQIYGKADLEGCLVESVSGLAVKAGLHPGDVILSIGGSRIRKEQDLWQCARDRCGGERVPLTLMRGGGAARIDARTGFDGIDGLKALR